MKIAALDTRLAGEALRLYNVVRAERDAAIRERDEARLKHHASLDEISAAVTRLEKASVKT